MSVKTCQFCPYSAYSSSNIDRHVVSVHFKKGNGKNNEIAIVQETSPSLSKVVNKKKKFNQQRSDFQKDSRKEKIDLFEKLSSWMEESQRQLAEVISSSDVGNDSNRGTAVLVEEVCDLKARLSIMTKERNRLLVSVRKMSDQIGMLRASLGAVHPSKEKSGNTNRDTLETYSLGNGYPHESFTEEARQYTQGTFEGNRGFGDHTNASAALTGDNFSSSVRWSKLDKSKEFVAFFKINIREEVEGYRCKPCGSGNLYKSKFGMYVHVRDKHVMVGTKYKCPGPQCKTITSNENQMKYHVDKKHPKLKGIIDVVGCLFSGGKGATYFDQGQQVTVEVNEKPLFEKNPVSIPDSQLQMGDEDDQDVQRDQMETDADDNFLGNVNIKVEEDPDEGLIGYKLCTTDMDTTLDKTKNIVKKPPPATNHGTTAFFTTGIRGEGAASWEQPRCTVTAQATNDSPPTMSSAPSDKSKEVATFFKENIVAEAGGHRCKPCGSGKLYKSKGNIDSHVRDKHIMGLIKFKCPSPQCPNPHMWVKSENGIKYHIHKNHPELKGKINLEECIVYRNLGRGKEAAEANMGQKASATRSEMTAASKLSQSEEVGNFYRGHVKKREAGYQCMVCGEAWLFKSKVAMNFHVKNMHVVPGIRYKCPTSLCLTISIDEKSLRAHISTKHPYEVKELNVQQCMVRSMKELSN